MGRIGRIKGFDSEKSLMGKSFLGLKKVSLFTVFAIAVLGFCWAVPARAADKLIVKDSTGTTTKFVVTDTGAVGSGVTEPNYPFDLSGQGNMASQMHFSLNGTDVGGWITSVLDNNFFLSSGCAYNNAAGGWIQKSSDGKCAIVGSQASDGYSVFMASGHTVGQVISSLSTPLRIDYSGNVGIGAATPTDKLDVNGNTIRIESSRTPASGSACNQGEISWDSSYVYVCVATNTWRRAALSAY